MRPSARTTVRPAAWKTMVMLAVVGLVFGFAGVGLLVATGSGYVRRPVDLAFADAEAAYGACQGFVRTQLKAPGPVTFAPVQRRTVRRYADGRVLVPVARGRHQRRRTPRRDTHHLHDAPAGWRALGPRRHRPAQRLSVERQGATGVFSMRPDIWPPTSPCCHVPE